MYRRYDFETTVTRYPMQKAFATEYFNRPVLEVAPALLGMYLVQLNNNGQRQAWQITEVEAYDGEHDLACHAAKGRTPRTEVMYGPAGHWYVYLVYGMHHMLNMVTGSEGYPAAVLVRGVKGYDGPGKLTKALAIDKKYNGRPACKQTGLWIEDRGEQVPPSAILQTPRIGVAYAGAWAERPWRFVLVDNQTKI